MKDEELFGLLKLPDEVIIKELRIELGKQASYIQELEDELKYFKSNNKEDVEAKRKIRTEQVFDEYRKLLDGCHKKNKELKETVERLKRDKDYLIGKLHVKK